MNTKLDKHFYRKVKGKKSDSLLKKALFTSTLIRRMASNQMDRGLDPIQELNDNMEELIQTIDKYVIISSNSAVNETLNGYRDELNNLYHRMNAREVQKLLTSNRGIAYLTNRITEARIGVFLVAQHLSKGEQTPALNEVKLLINRFNTDITLSAVIPNTIRTHSSSESESESTSGSGSGSSQSMPTSADESPDSVYNSDQ